MEFKVKRDFIPIFLINALMLLICACSVFFFIAIDNLGWLIIVIAVDLFFFVLYNTSVIFARCTLSEDKLIYRTGIFKYTMPVDKIAKITKARNYHLSLALSFDRIRVLVVGETGKQCVYYISVVDSNRLMKAIKPTDPNIVENNREVKPEQPEAKTEEIAEKTENEVVTTTPKTTTKSSGTTKKPASKSTSSKSTATKSTTTKKASTTTKKSN